MELRHSIYEINHKGSKVDVDRSRAAATKYQIQSVPTLIFFNKGKVVWRKSGAQSLHTLEGLVKPYVS